MKIMKRLSLYLIGLLLVPALFLTSCDRGDDIIAENPIFKPTFETLKEYMLTNNLDINYILSGPDGSAKFVTNIGKENNTISLLYGNKHTNSVYVRDLWNKICHQAWKNGEPGVIFIDTVNNKHPLDEKISATNPCGEQPLLPYEACCLGSINLSKFVKKIGMYSNKTDSYNSIAWSELTKTIRIAQP